MQALYIMSIIMDFYSVSIQPRKSPVLRSAVAIPRPKPQRRADHLGAANPA